MKCKSRTVFIYEVEKNEISKEHTFNIIKNKLFIHIKYFTALNLNLICEEK